MDAISFEHFIVLLHIQNNGKDEPITFFPSAFDAQFYIRGQRAMQGGLGVSPMDLGDSPCKLGVMFKG